ncbi:hypothetical protein R4Y45_06230 [Holzapfeliella sp. He02]|uniref:Uncharacterized protein n=1 Tax=Holzapfeliella saturejae TaxID=3082953 RepID=A0ABU8SJI6_9LACO
MNVKQIRALCELYNARENGSRVKFFDWVTSQSFCFEFEEPKENETTIQRVCKTNEAYKKVLDSFEDLGVKDRVVTKTDFTESTNEIKCFLIKKRV